MKIKVGLGFCFLDKEKEIPRALDPIYKHVDKIYGIHGRFINYELDHDFSIDNSVKVVESYPNAVVHEYKPQFQTDMRQHYLDLAGEDKMDYLIVWDSDDIIHPDYQDWTRFYKSLQRYSKKYPEYRIFKMKAWIPSDWRKAYNESRNNTWKPYVRIHKDPGNQRYALYCHWWWCPKNVTDEDLINQTGPMYISDHTIDYVRFTTDSKLRDRKTLDIRDNWAWNNICEEQRRSYIKSEHCHGRTDLQFEGYYRYDREGRILSKICNEDGSQG